MKDEIEYNGKKYLPSRLAAEAVGYTQDYVGQLARKGEIEAQRNSGMWYVSLGSLKAHKEKAAQYVPTPPSRPQKTDKEDTFVTFDGKKYVSTARGAKITGYVQDYVAQLAREGIVPSRQAGGRWYVEKEPLEGHKEESDAKLAAVQAQSVGIKKRKEQPTPLVEPETLRYVAEESNLLPEVPKKTHIESKINKNVDDKGIVADDSSEEQKIPAHHRENMLHRVPSRAVQGLDLYKDDEDVKKGKGQAQKAVFAASGAFLILLIVVGFYTSFSSVKFVRSDAGTYNSASKNTQVSLAGSSGVSSLFDHFLTKNLEYSR